MFRGFAEQFPPASKTAVEDVGLIACSLLAACPWNCAADLVCGHRGLEK